MKKLLVGLLMVFFAASAGAAPVYVGSWYVGDGPVWTSNPTVLNAQETAALLFGGVASDYAISTVSDQVADINFMAFVDGWGDDQFLFTPVAQNFSFDQGAPGYDDPSGTATAYSAYVLDHSCDNRYNDPQAACTSNVIGLNFAFRVDAVPEPATLLLMAVGLAGLGLSRRRLS